MLAEAEGPATARDGSVAVASEATGLTRCGTEPTAVASAGRRPGNAALIASTFGVAADGMRLARFGEMLVVAGVSGFAFSGRGGAHCRSILARPFAKRGGRRFGRWCGGGGWCHFGNAIDDGREIGASRDARLTVRDRARGLARLSRGGAGCCTSRRAAFVVDSAAISR